MAEAEVTLHRATAADAAALIALNNLRAADEAGNPWSRPTGRELQDARHAAQVAARVRKQAADALEVARAAVQREQAEAQRRQRRAALDCYLARLVEAAEVWPAVIAAGPVMGLGPAIASPDEVAAFRAWTDRHVP